MYENCKKVATKHKKMFSEKFYNEKKKCLYDVLGDAKIRPNQLFALSLTYPVLDLNSEIAYEVFNTVTDKLLLERGLRTLAKTEKGYIPVYEGDYFKRDMSYHQGVSWVWLLGLYFDSLRNMKNAQKDKKLKKEFEDKYNEFIKTTYETFKIEINEGEGIGNISEMYDSKAPYKSKGTFAQAWSVSEVLKICQNLK